MSSIVIYWAGIAVWGPGDYLIRRLLRSNDIATDGRGLDHGR